MNARNVIVMKLELQRGWCIRAGNLFRQCTPSAVDAPQKPPVV
jgi:hypothetical protein